MTKQAIFDPMAAAVKSRAAGLKEKKGKQGVKKIKVIYHLPETLIEKIREKAYNDRRPMSSVVELILEKSLI